MSKKVILFIVYLVIIGGISIYSIYKADYNWDVLPYIASVYSMEGNDTTAVHKMAFGELKKSTDEKTYLMLTSGSYRETMLNCAKCFYQQLPFFKIKPLYIALIYLLNKLNTGIIISPIIISAVFYFLVCIVVYVWIKPLVNNELYSLLISVLLAVSPFVMNSASMATPDSLSGFLVLFALFSLMVKKNLSLFILLMILSVFARPDNIIIFFILSGVIYYSKNFESKKIILFSGLLIGIICVVLINKLSGNYGYTALYSHTFIERLTSPADYSGGFSLNMYLKGMLNWIFTLKHSFFSVQMFILILAVYIRKLSGKEFKNDFELQMLLAMGGSIIIHFLIFPLMDDRFFTAQYLLIDILFIKSAFFNLREHKVTN